MLGERILNIKLQLKQVAKRDLLEMVFGQTEENCILSGTCPFLLKYQQTRFCVSEVLGHGCQMEKLKASPDNGETEGREHDQDPSLDLSASSYLPGFG